MNVEPLTIKQVEMQTDINANRLQRERHERRHDLDGMAMATITPEVVVNYGRVEGFMAAKRDYLDSGRFYDRYMAGTAEFKGYMEAKYIIKNEGVVSCRI